MLARIGNTELVAPISGLVRGMIRNQTRVAKDLKIGDIDPRIDEEENCYTISDKARCISGGVLVPYSRKPVIKNKKSGESFEIINLN